ncbi:S10 family peptidase [Verrucomicrobium spinosum]|uniref:S10 family peptidase n=1 Tax=Verrucomicrobium spinosum TaxID=2736 RepID=UPI00017462BA|nr:peptidase S10 [Verrucomicrobium spinosum]
MLKPLTPLPDWCRRTAALSLALMAATSASPIFAESPSPPPGGTPPAAAPGQAKPNGNDKEKEKEKAKEPEKAADKEKETPRQVQSQHSVVINGTAVSYTATAGMMPLKDAEGKTTAEIFFMAYTKDGVADVTKRPVTFSFNGGPGSSSVWMHLGLLGPRRVKLKEDGSALPPPYQLVDNEYSLLDETDLVFIDPVGTGYSRATKLDEAKRFYGVKEDTASVAEFIRLYVTKNTRWASPKFLIGESYGTTRAAALSGELGSKHLMNLNGIMLVSTVLNFQTIWGGPGNDLPHVLYLPSFTATAWHHKKLSAELQKLPLTEVLKQAEAFAMGDYNHALMQGSALPPATRQAVLKQLASFTGLTVEYLDRADLRPSLQRFGVELLRDKDLQIGRFDSRYTGHVRDRLTETTEGDPSADAVFSAYASTFNHYIRTELKFEEDKPYEILTGSVQPWNWGAENDFVNVSETLAKSMTKNPFLKVHVSQGYTDLATPYFAAKYTFTHLDVAPDIAKNLVMDEYQSGHMMYLNLPDLVKQKADLAKFIRGASGAQP